VGGSVFWFRCDGRPVLREGDPTAADPLRMAAFPLIPFTGRIDQGRFEFAGLQVRLPPNFPPEPHAIHGQAWQSPWRVEAATTDRAVLSYEHAPDAWPWRYRARQAFVLDGHGLKLDLAVTNLAATAMPAGLGWHPYFPAAGARLEADVGVLWPAGAGEARPLEAGEGADLRRERAVAGLDLDHVYGAGPRGARLTWPGRQVAVRASPELAYLVVYAPKGADHFCVEPWSHVPDAVNRPPAGTGLRVLAPGETLSASVVLGVAGTPQRAD
jgi:aldose 1-epimerase